MPAETQKPSSGSLGVTRSVMYSSYGTKGVNLRLSIVQVLPKKHGLRADD